MEKEGGGWLVEKEGMVHGDGMFLGGRVSWGNMCDGYYGWINYFCYSGVDGSYDIGLRRL